MPLTIRADIPEEGVARIRVARIVSGISLQVPGAILVLERGLRGPEEYLLREVDRDPPIPFIRGSGGHGHGVDVDPPFLAAKEDLEVPAGPQLPGAALRLADEDEAVVEFTRLDEDLMAKYEPLQGGHQGLGRLREHHVRFLRGRASSHS